MRIGFCDDSRIDIKMARDIIEPYLEEQNIAYTISEFSTKEQVLDEARQLDMIFLDIDLGGKDDGITIAKELHKKWRHCQIVFLTQYVDYVSDVYATEHVYFVLKDQLSSYIDKLFDIILHNQKEMNTKLYFTLPHKHTIGLFPRSIIYIERSTRKSIIHTRRKTYEVDDKIGTLMTQLAEYDFARCHNSFIVSLAAVTEVRVDHITLLESIEIPMSRQYKKHFKEAYLLYSARQLP